MGQTGDECWQLEKAIQMEFNAILIELHCNVFAALSHSTSFPCTPSLSILLCLCICICICICSLCKFYFCSPDSVKLFMVNTLR